MSQANTNPGFDRVLAFKVGLTVLLLAAILALASSWSFYYEAMANAYLSLALASAVIVLAVLRRSWFDMLWVVTGGLFLALLDYRILGYEAFFMSGFSFAGMSALGILGVGTIWARQQERKLLLYGFVPAALFVASEWCASYLLDLTEALHPKTFDVFLYSFDISLRVQIIPGRPAAVEKLDAADRIPGERRTLLHRPGGCVAVLAHGASTLFLHAAVTPGERRNAFLVGIFSTLIWLALLSFSVQILWSSPLAPWTMIVATAASSIHFWRRLLRAGAARDSFPSKVAVAAAGA